MNPLIDLPLWKRLVHLTKDNTDNLKMIEDHIAYAVPLLDRFVDTFPKYTLHNGQHQRNVTKLMGDLIEEYLEKITGLEAAILILSAVYHDIGMVYDVDALKSITEEADFIEFLNDNLKAKLKYEELNKNVDNSLVSWYCRWMHAKRVWIYLNIAEASIPFTWDGMPIKNALGYVCQSHNESLDFISSRETDFDTNFLGDCDLSFCAIILRLADIMDFDNSRTPKSVYEFLKLDVANNASDIISKEEWLKHLSSHGFTINSKQKQWLFKAAPKYPSVEIGIRKYIKLIDSELYACNKFLKYCSQKWRDVELPVEINTDNIKSNNYKSGDYHLSLAKDKVMTLLTGDGIYNDEYIFLRELLQNAIDTSRHREFKENIDNKEFKIKPIEVSSFIDKDGYRWIRIDDYGMGMNQEIIENHLLRKGESYYSSDRFKLEKLLIKEKSKIDFVPISRFGIGLLSCFILGDNIEISTLHKNEPGNALRLSLQGRDGFFTLQSKKDHHVAAPMPSEYNSGKSGYRSEPGTTIAVRINTNKEHEGNQMKDILERYVLCSPIQINFEGVTVGGNSNELLNTPWAKNKVIDLEDTFVQEAENITGLNFDNGIQIIIHSINLTSQSLDPRLMGQIVIVYIRAITNTKKVNHLSYTKFRLSLEDSNLYLHCSHYDNSTKKNIEKSIKSEAVNIDNHIRIPKQVWLDSIYTDKKIMLDGIRLSHNGIRVSGDREIFSLNNNLFGDNQSNDLYDSHQSFLCSGIIYLQDELLPDLTVSRNEIKNLSFEIVANIITATRNFNEPNSAKSLFKGYDFFHNIDQETTYTVNVIEKSQFYEKNKDFWDQYITVNTPEGPLTISELKSRSFEKISIVNRRVESQFYTNFVNYVIQQNFRVTIEFLNSENYPAVKILLSSQSSPLPQGAKDFAPLTFIDFENSKTTLIFNNYINCSHPYVKWYFKSFLLLNEEYNYYSRQLIHLLYGFLFMDNPEIEKINRILNRLRNGIHSEIYPPHDITLTAKDFEINVR